MSVVTRLADKKQFNALKNGENFNLNTGDFAQFLQSNVLEPLRMEITVAVGWYKALSEQAILYTTDGPGFEGYFQQPGVDWGEEGFFVGDFLDFTRPLVPTNVFVLVTGITEDKLFVSFNIAQTDITAMPENSFLKGTSQLLGCTFKYGLIEQDESFNTLSKLTGTDQKYYIDSILHSGPPGPVVFGFASGDNKAWVTGTVTAQFIGPTFDDDRFRTPNDDTFQEFKIIQDFIVLPFVQDGETNKLINRTQSNLFKGSNTLKHVFTTEFQRALTNPNTTKPTEFEDRQGSVGGFGQSFNGFINHYAVVSLTYEDLATGDPLDQISVLDTTRINFQVKKNNGNFAFPLIGLVTHCRIPTLAEYRDSPMEWQALWTYNFARQLEGSPGVASGAITNFTLDIDGGDASLLNGQFDLILSTAQKSLIENLGYYVIPFNIQDFALTGEDTDRVQLLLDVNQYFVNPDIPGLLDYTKHDLYKHPFVYEDTISTGNTSLKVFNESGIMIDLAFNLNMDLIPVIEQVKVGLAAHNATTGDFFEIQSEVLPLTFTTVSGRQKLQFISTRGFNLADDDQFNLRRFRDIGTSPTEEFYDLQYGVKISWQEWLELPGANEIFYDPTKNFNGLNKKTSNYSLKEGYLIGTFVEVIASKDGVNTTYRDVSNSIDVVDYEEEHDGQDLWDTCVLETKETGGADLNGNFLTDQEVITKWIITPKAPFVPVVADYYCILRIEEQQQAGDDIDELSSIKPFPDGNRLIPLVGETQAKIYLDSGNLIAEARSNLAAIIDTPYTLSVEIDRKTVSVARDFSDDFSIDFS